jgi:methionine synthase reductase
MSSADNESSDCPYVGAGTGVAPFVGFLQHRSKARNKDRDRIESGDEDMCCGVWRGGFELETKDLPSECNRVGEFMRSQQFGDIYLFFGCRDETDYLFREELQSFLVDSRCDPATPDSGSSSPLIVTSPGGSVGVLTHLDVAMSRTGPSKVYVTHKLRAMGKQVAHLLVNECAYLYICGDGNHMAKDVGSAIKEILVEHASMTEKQADEMIADLKQRRRYVLDIWS